MKNLEELEKEINLIKERNNKVELDKSWERSYLRRILLILFTYFAISIYLYAIDIQKPWQNAIVPAVAFWLSTLTLPFFKKLWTKYTYRSKKIN